jgi:hypothetical protein
MEIFFPDKGIDQNGGDCQHIIVWLCVKLLIKIAMPCWYYDKKELRNTPSTQDDIDYETECRYRKEGARFIITAGTKMDLGYNTAATGVVYFHRFYMFHSFR